MAVDSRSLEHPWHSLTHFLLRGWNIYITDGPRALLSAPRGGDSNWRRRHVAGLAALAGLWVPGWPVLVYGCLGAHLTALCFFMGAWSPSPGSRVPVCTPHAWGDYVGLLRGVRPVGSRSIWHHCDPLNETIPYLLGPSYPCPAAGPVQSSAEMECPPYPRTHQHAWLVAQTWPVRFLFQCQ